MSDEDFFKNAMVELESGDINKGLLAKCFAETGGDENRAKAKYISVRVEALKAEQGGRETRHPALSIAIYQAILFVCLIGAFINNNFSIFSGEARPIGAIIKPDLEKFESKWSQESEDLVPGITKNFLAKTIELDRRHERAFAGLEKHEIQRQEVEDFWRIGIAIAIIVIGCVQIFNISGLARMGWISTWLLLVLFPFGWAFLVYRAKNNFSLD
jgi:hypothetical protein